MENNYAENAAWIENDLVPSLVADGKLTFGAAAQPATVRSVDIKRISIEESTMLTVCYRVTVTLGPAGGDDVTVDDVDKDALAVAGLIVKYTPKVTKEMFEEINFGNLFNNEILAYTKILPSLGWTEGVPKFYYSHLREDEAVIVMGDFGVDGWKMAKTKVNLSLEHILVSVKRLGKLHGLMYGLKHTDRANFDRITADLKEPRFVAEVPPKMWDDRLTSGPKRALKSIRSHPEIHEQIPNEFLTSLEKFFSVSVYAYQKRRVLPEEPLAVLLHGDYLRNNIAYKYSDEQDETPVDALPFDFQTLRYASPMIDFTTFICNSTGFEVRRPHFDEIFSAYHAAIVEHYTKYTGSADVPDFLSHDSLLREYAIYLPFGFSIAAAFLPMLHDPLDFAVLFGVSEEDNVKDAFSRGGESVDRELRAFVQEIYELNTKFGLEFKL